MKTLLLGILGAVLAQSIYAADFTGHWLATSHLPDGQTRETSLWLKSDKDVLTGYMTANEQTDPVVEGKINGNGISFIIVRDYYGETRKTQYTGTLQDGVLTLRMPGFGGRVRELPFKQVSTEPPGPPPAPQPKISLPPASSVPYNGLAKTPPMGWNSWNKFARRVSDQLVRETADAMVRNGMKDAGYIYVNIDDTWEDGRDPHGNIKTNEKFPDMKALADYVHSKGLKLGIYSSPGPKTCAGYEGSFQHEEQDAKTYAQWGIDYLKYDWCSAVRVYDYHSMQAVYAKMGEALLQSGRPIVYSLCQYGLLHGPQWGAKVGGNLWRTTGDIRDTWDSMSHIGFDLQIGLSEYAGPGHWNDPDMLEIGNGGMNDTEYRTHMSLWSLLAAPLLAGNDQRNAPPDILEILTNKEVIAVDQDPLGKEANRVAKNGDLEVWARPLKGGDYAAGLFNRGASTAKVTARWSDIGISGKARVRDLWAHADRGEMSDEFSAEVPSHGVVMIKLTK
ncbi:MAG TPA: glycoside hydrolase family 27 protein [Bryobacteraceae bacterium]|nr:glycoside hydrolase family 27 protein [Bryobacteraceae bacterium]